MKTNLLIVAAAGNHGTVVDNTSPAANSNALTVGATNKDDRICDFSNQGVRVDLFAPGECPSHARARLNCTSETRE